MTPSVAGYRATSPEDGGGPSMRRLQLVAEGANSAGVLAEIRFPDAAFRADVDARAARAFGTDAHDDVIRHAEPVGDVDRLDPPFVRRAGDDVPAHRHRDLIDPVKGLGRRDGQQD